MKTLYWICITMLIAAVAPLPMAAAYAEDVPLPIDKSSDKACLPMDETQASLGMETSCAWGTLSALIKGCTKTSAELSSCYVEFTGTVTVGPLVGGVFASDAGTTSAVWGRDSLNTKTVSTTVPFHNVPRAGGALTGAEVTLQASVVGLTPKETVQWTPTYTFPRDPSYNPSSGGGCTSGSASASMSGASLALASEDLGIKETVTISPMQLSSTRTDPDIGDSAEVVVSSGTPGC